MEEYIYKGAKVWMKGVVGLPVEVEVIEIEKDGDKKAKVKTRTQEGYVHYEKLFPSEEECPTR